MMKPVLGAALAAVLLVGMLAGCGSGAEKQAEPDALLLQTAVEQAVAMGGLAADETFRSAYTLEDDMLALMEEMGRQDYRTPERALLVRFEEEKTAETLEKLLGQELDFDFDALPEEVRQALGERMVAAYPNQLTAQYSGYLAIALSGALANGYSMPKPEQLEDTRFVILLYEGDWAMFTLYRPGQGDTMTAFTTPVLLDETVRAVLEGGELPGLGGAPVNTAQVTQVSGEELAKHLAAA